jgi:solute carrier family 40 (iron-regulated transporter), member 1
VPIVLALWAISSYSSSQDEVESLLAIPRRVFIEQPPWGWSLVLFSFIAMSRLGVWIFDLTTQQLTQVLVAETQRSSFAGAENSVVNIFELLGAGTAIAFPRNDQYKWLSVASLIGVVISSVMYAGWVRAERGHLLHWDKLGQGICAKERT